MQSILGNTRLPDVTFYPNGRIDISARIARMLDLHRGDVIDIAKDEGEYLLYVQRRGDSLVGNYEATCIPSKVRSHNMRAYSKRLCSYMFRFAKDKSQPLRIPAGDVAEYAGYGRMVTLITRITINNKHND